MKKIIALLFLTIPVMAGTHVQQGDNLVAASLQATGLTSGRCVQTTTGGLLSVATDPCGTGSGGGTSIYPATATASFPFGISVSTISLAGTLPLTNLAYYSTATVVGYDPFCAWNFSGTVLASSGSGWLYLNTTPAAPPTSALGNGCGINLTTTGSGTSAYLYNNPANFNPTTKANWKLFAVVSGSSSANTDEYFFGLTNQGAGTACDNINFSNGCVQIIYREGTDTNWQLINCDAFSCDIADTGTPYVAGKKTRMYLRAGTAGTVYACANVALDGTCNVAEVNSVTANRLPSIGLSIVAGSRQGGGTATGFNFWYYAYSIAGF